MARVVAAIDVVIPVLRQTAQVVSNVADILEALRIEDDRD